MHIKNPTALCICCYTTLSAKQAINDKLQGSVATYLRCGGVVNNQIKKGLLLSLKVKKMLKSVNIWQSYKQERGCLVHFLRLLAKKIRPRVTLATLGSSYFNVHSLPCITCIMSYVAARL